MRNKLFLKSRVFLKNLPVHSAIKLNAKLNADIHESFSLVYRVYRVCTKRRFLFTAEKLSFVTCFHCHFGLSSDMSITLYFKQFWKRIHNSHIVTVLIFFNGNYCDIFNERLLISVSILLVALLADEFFFNFYIWIFELPCDLSLWG